jgi:hypothetical protein
VRGNDGLDEITTNGTTVTWGLIKPRQAVALASWLVAHRGPVLLGADANTQHSLTPPISPAPHPLAHR